MKGAVVATPSIRDHGIVILMLGTTRCNGYTKIRLAATALGETGQCKNAGLQICFHQIVGITLGYL